MDFKAVEKKWAEKWKQTKEHSFDPKRVDKKQYVLEMFSYPSGANLHLGHWFNYGPTDSYARFKKMQGYEVFEPMGFDAFGLPAENYAIKTGIHPKDSTEKNIKTMEGQLSRMNAMFNWDAELYTCDPDYYKWTQWLFLQLYKHGLAYQKLSPVNWCDSCNTVIANEQVVDGKCERCGTEIKRKNMTQWFLKITDYSEQLLEGLDKIDWPEKTKIMQRNWIGKSVGGEVEFTLTTGQKFKVFTTRADTLFGVSYVVLAPEHPLVDEITTPEQKEIVENYKKEVAKISDIDRQSTVKEKSGVFTGAYAVNPINNKKVPVWIADYCLATYGTGAVMGVPAHDDRDFAFAQKFGLPITRVVKSANGKNDDLPYCEHGVTTNSGEFDGLKTKDAIIKILKKLESTNQGGIKVNYRLRDWSVSRQRYWGAPIPIIHCEHCGAVPVPEKDLPVTLPYDVNFTPDGKSPLSKSEEFMNCTCPICGRKARRDPDTLDTFVCSSWYYLRYPDNKNKDKPFDTEWINKMLPVDKYVGGAEHACMHLLYARFITKALKDMGYVNFDEPFTSLVHQGVILGPDGTRMSKSKGNIINPDKYTSEYGADVFRMYLMFGFDYSMGGPWNEEGIKSISKFLERVERVINKANGEKETKQVTKKAEEDLEYALNYCIKNVTNDFEHFSFNTAIARIMELVNAIYKLEENVSVELYKKCAYNLVLLLSPITPTVAEELHEMLGYNTTVTRKPFPVCDETKLVKSEIEIAVQFNSKVKAKINIPTKATNDEITSIALNDEKVKSLLNGATIKKTIVIPSRLINFII